jgi:hypothetical protein
MRFFIIVFIIITDTRLVMQDQRTGDESDAPRRLQCYLYSAPLAPFIPAQENADAPQAAHQDRVSLARSVWATVRMSIFPFFLFLSVY